MFVIAESTTTVKVATREIEHGASVSQTHPAGHIRLMLSSIAENRRELLESVIVPTAYITPKGIAGRTQRYSVFVDPESLGLTLNTYKVFIGTTLTNPAIPNTLES